MARNEKRLIARLMREFESQGARVRRNKDGGYVVYCPDGKSVLVIHLTMSDHRSMRNFRASALRAGLTWPSDI
jgi:hypothetical protein